MLCPACGYENLIGADSCDNCGAELAGHDLPQPAVTFHSTLLGEHLDSLGSPAPIIVPSDTTARRGRRGDALGGRRLRPRRR